MRTRPPELTDTDIRDALARGWGVVADRVSYLPVGFGSHHWDVVAGAARWFFTVDDLEDQAHVSTEPLPVAAARLRAALATARDLADAGLSFVVAPVPTISGDVLTSIGEDFAAALYPFIEGTRRDWGEYASRAERMAVLDRVMAIHAATSTHAQVEDGLLPMGDVLLAALDDLDARWTSGPYGERARLLLRRHAAGVQQLLRLHGGDRPARTGRQPHVLPVVMGRHRDRPVRRRVP